MQSAGPFTLTSTAFAEGDSIPRRFACDGDDVSPDLMWAGAPERTVAFVLIVNDPDARDFTHWLVYDMAGSASGGLPEAISATQHAVPQGMNDFGRIGYGGPCPPSGTHRYRFTLYALDRLLGLAGTPRARELRAAMAGHVIASATLTGTYRRG